jgi:hypothetical protein
MKFLYGLNFDLTYKLSDSPLLEGFGKIIKAAAGY